MVVSVKGSATLHVQGAVPTIELLSAWTDYTQATTDSAVSVLVESGVSTVFVVGNVGTVSVGYRGVIGEKVLSIQGYSVILDTSLSNNSHPGFASLVTTRHTVNIKTDFVQRVGVGSVTITGLKGVFSVVERRTPLSRSIQLKAYRRLRVPPERGKFVELLESIKYTKL